MQVEETGTPGILTEVPVEILESIADYLDMKTLIDLQSTARHFRQVLSYKSWYHLHLDVIDIGDPPIYFMHPTDELDDVSDERSFMAKRRAPLRCMKIDQSNLRDFCQGVVSGALQDVLPLVRVFTLETQYFHPAAQKVAMDNVIVTCSNFDMVNWLFTRTLRGLLTGIIKMELFVDVDGVGKMPILRKLLDRLPQVETNLKIEGVSSSSKGFKIPLMNLKIFKWVVVKKQSDQLQPLLEYFGGQLPLTIERLEICVSVPTEVDAQVLESFLPRNGNLKTLMLRPFDIKNSSRYDWLPNSVQDLALFDRSKFTGPPVEYPQVRYLMVDTLGGSIFKRMRFPNLERLYISYYTGGFPVDLSYCPIKQLRCESMEPDVIEKLYNSNIKSLIIDKPVKELAIPGDPAQGTQALGMLHLAGVLKNLDWLLVDISVLETRESLLNCLHRIVMRNPGITLYVQDMLERRASWMAKTRGLLHDGISVIRPAEGFIYKCDTEVLKRWSPVELEL